jgi:hypothetical protein
MEALPRLSGSLAHHCPQPVDVEWLEDLQGDVSVAALRRGRSTEGRADPSWLPEPGEMEGVVNGFHLLAPSGALHGGWGASSVEMRLPVPLTVPVGAFFQGNRHLATWLFGRVRELVGSGSEPLWDLHAGVGFLAAAAASDGARAPHLVEPFRPAARAADLNLPHATVSASTAEAYLAGRRELPREAMVIVDPPRAGLSPEQRRRLAGWHPRRVLMLACDPATWSRDAAFLLERGYELRHLELVDLFPSTHHVEMLALLEAV